MKSLTCKLPPHVEFSTPYDYVKNCDGGGVVAISVESTLEGTFTVRWDDKYYYFVANNTVVSYLRSGVRNICINKNLKIMNWPICRLDIELADGGFLLLSAHKKYEQEFDEIIQCLQKASLPFTIYPDHSPPKASTTR